MKYTTQIEINLPREEVLQKFENLDNMKHWQRGLISYEPISGVPGEEGAKCRLKYKMDKREIEMIETITRKNLPQELFATYEAKGVYNLQENFFETTDSNTTSWVSHCEFRFSGFMKLIGMLMPGAFKKQSMQFMEDFKNFSETGKSVA